MKLIAYQIDELSIYFFNFIGFEVIITFKLSLIKQIIRRQREVTVGQVNHFL